MTRARLALRIRARVVVSFLMLIMVGSCTPFGSPEWCKATARKIRDLEIRSQSASSDSVNCYGGPNFATCKRRDRASEYAVKAARLRDRYEDEGCR
jgi:hypothetical protein